MLSNDFQPIEGGVLLVKVMLFNPDAPSNAEVAIVVTFDGISIADKDEQYLKLLSPIYVS